MKQRKKRELNFQNSPKAKNKLVKATWFSGKIRIPIGNMTMFEDRGYDSRFEKEQIITINRGEIIKSVTLDFMAKLTVATQQSA